jgi:hypothetical protein
MLICFYCTTVIVLFTVNLFLRNKSVHGTNFVIEVGQMDFASWQHTFIHSGIISSHKTKSSDDEFTVPSSVAPCNISSCSWNCRCLVKSLLLYRFRNLGKITLYWNKFQKMKMFPGMVEELEHLQEVNSHGEKTNWSRKSSWRSDS